MEEERLVGGGSRHYGACLAVRRQEQLPFPAGKTIKHRVEPGDTLQGLALKYSTTMEKIRRANRLFASDSLFLREFLLIPVSKDSPVSSPEEVPTRSEALKQRASIGGVPTSTNEFLCGSPDEKKTFDDFLNRVDSSLASIKKDVEKTSEKSEFGRYSADLYTRRKPTSRLRQSASVGGVGTSRSSAETSDNSYQGTMGETVVMAQGRHVRSSLQRLQRTQDDWFQL